MADHFDCFSVLFGRGELYIDGEPFPLGQCATDILNLDSAVLAELDQRVGALMPAVKNLFSEKTDSAVRSAQEQLNAVWDLIFDLPVYRNLELDKWSAYELFPLLRSQKEKLAATLDERSEAHQMFQQLTDGLEYFPASLRNFRGQVTGMLEFYFELLKRRGADAYAAAYAQYFSVMRAAGAMLLGANDFEQSFPVRVKFVPMKHLSEDGKVILVEQAEFTYLSHFLYMDFYRGLRVGNAPRRCHNCGRYFLLTEGYNTCYCNNIAPGETERTCRKVGAHRKEAKERAGTTPAQKEYAKAYNRLKMRKQRRKISVDEWNAAVRKAQELKAQNERGELSDEALLRQLKAL